MSIIKLVPGQRIALTVAKTEQVEGNYGPQIKFSGSTPDDTDAAIFLNVETAQQQLGRIGLTLDSVIGHTVEIERVEKNGRKFTNINKLGGVDFKKLIAQPSHTKQGFSSGGPLPWEQEETGAPPKAAQGQASPLDKLFTLYDTCFQHAFSLAERTMKQDASHEGISAMAATVFIAAKDKGLGA